MTALTMKTVSWDMTSCSYMQPPKHWYTMYIQYGVIFQRTNDCTVVVFLPLTKQENNQIPILKLHVINTFREIMMGAFSSSSMCIFNIIIADSGEKTGPHTVAQFFSS
jgi:hypothetical protein